MKIKREPVIDLQRCGYVIGEVRRRERMPTEKKRRVFDRLKKRKRRRGQVSDRMRDRVRTRGNESKQQRQNRERERGKGEGERATELYISV